VARLALVLLGRGFPFRVGGPVVTEPDATIKVVRTADEVFVDVLVDHASVGVLQMTCDQWDNFGSHIERFGSDAPVLVVRLMAVET
jgi:hypothetical protein